MSLFADYMKERENVETLEFEKGFITFKMLPDNSIYMKDIYVIPEARREGVGTFLTDKVCEIAKERGCSKVFGSVCIDASNCTDSMKAQLAYGMKLHSIKGNMIYLVKDIGSK